MAKIITLMNRVFVPALTLILSLAPAWHLEARTNLVSLPDRGKVMIRLTGQNAALVQEERVLSLKKGLNKVDFSWQNVAIDPFSIILEPVGKDGTISLLSVSFPPNEPALIWDIHAKENTAQPVIISYLLSGIDSLVTYKATADQEEKRLHLKSYLVLRNFSGENFDPAHIWLNPETVFSTRSQNLETRKILFFDKKGLKVFRVYTWDSAVMPHDPEKEQAAVGIPAGYKIKNTEDAGLGFVDLIRGKARIFQADSDDSLIFAGEDLARFVPKGDETVLVTGKTRDIIVARHRMDTQKTNIRRNKKGKIQVYDEIITDQYTIENTRDKAVTLTIKDHIPGQWEPVDMGHEYKKENFKTLVFDIPLQPGEKKTLALNYKRINVFARDFPRY